MARITEAATLLNAKGDKGKSGSGSGWGPSADLLSCTGIGRSTRYLACLFHFGGAGNKAGSNVHDDLVGIVGAGDDEIGTLGRVGDRPRGFDQHTGANSTSKEQEDRYNSVVPEFCSLR